jgi:hypothetical protein
MIRGIGMPCWPARCHHASRHIESMRAVGSSGRAKRPSTPASLMHSVLDDSGCTSSCKADTVILLSTCGRSCCWLLVAAPAAPACRGCCRQPSQHHAGRRSCSRQSATSAWHLRGTCWPCLAVLGITGVGDQGPGVTGGCLHCVLARAKSRKPPTLSALSAGPLSSPLVLSTAHAPAIARRRSDQRCARLLRTAPATEHPALIIRVTRAQPRAGQRGPCRF